LIDNGLTAKHDLRILKAEIETKLTKQKAELINDLVKWIIGVAAAQAMLILAALHFFH
jgi:hypothetical protein